MIPRRLYFKYALVAAGFFVYAIIICLFKGYDHDEGMYISCANLVIKGFVPYRDFFYTHPPYFLYAIAPFLYIFKYQLLTGRLFSALLGIMSAFFLAFGICYTEQNRKISLFSTVSAVCLIMLGAVTIYTQSLAWNHQLALFLVSCGYWLFFYCHNKEKRKLFFVSGLFFALAAGVRIPLVLLFILSLFLIFVIYRNKRASIYFATGFIFGMIPLSLFLIFYTQEFIFSIFSIHTYTPMLLKSMGMDYNCSFIQKLNVFSSIIVRNQADLITLIIFVFAFFYFRFDLESRIYFIYAIACLFMFFFHGAVWPQYLYPLFMFTLPMVARFFQDIVNRVKAAKYGIVMLLVFVFFIGPFDNYFRSIFLDTQPVAIAIHQSGKMLRSLTKQYSVYPTSPVLTLTPIIAQEGELDIYPEFSTGPFVWRISTLVEDDERERLNIIDPENLGDFLHQEPPSAILTGFEKRWEQPIIHWAQINGYDSIELGGRRKIWVPLQHSANKSLRK
jgi:hypothetical protein